MNITHHADKGRRNLKPGLYETDPRDSKIVRLFPRKTVAPTVACGSGWYHDEAITRVGDAEPHAGL